MKLFTRGAAKRLIFSLLLGGALTGCAVYGPPPPAYGYGPPVYAGPPVSFDLGFGFYDFGRVHHHRGHRLHHHHHHGPRVHHHHHRGHRGVHHGHRGFGRGRH